MSLLIKCLACQKKLSKHVQLKKQKENICAGYVKYRTLGKFFRKRNFQGEHL